MLTRVAWLVGVGVGVLVGCGGSSSKSSSPAAVSGAGMGAGGSAGSSSAGTAGSGPVVSAADAPVVVAVALCEKAFTCCTADELMNVGKSTCELLVAGSLTLTVNSAEGSLASGRLVYDGGALSACVDDYTNRSCDALRAITGLDCPGLLAPQVEPGGACGSNLECIDGYCDGGTDPANPSGQCAPKKEHGASCTDVAQCFGGACDNSQCGDAAALSLCAI